jgi:signal peptidase I
METPDKLPDKAATAFVVALVAAGLSLLYVPWNPVRVLDTVVMVAAAIGLRKRNVWAGYGAALFEMSTSGAELAVRVRFGRLTPLAPIIGATALNCLIAWVLFRGGRALSGARRRGSARAWIALSVATFLSFQAVRSGSSSTPSMEDTLLIGDYFLFGLVGASHPARGDLVVCRMPGHPIELLVKRCLGVPGDRIKLANKRLYVNGRPLDETYVSHRSASLDPYRDNFPGKPTVRLPESGQDMLQNHVQDGEVVVPPDNFFVLGDNRDASADSRYFGFVSRSDITGRPWIIYWSFAAPSSTAAGLDAVTGRYLSLVTKTRWNRILKPLRSSQPTER